MAFVANAGINLHYERTGSGPPLLFLHTWLTSHLFWKDQVSYLRRQHQIVTLDLRGHGDSSKPKGAYTRSILTRDVKRIVEALSIKDAIIVGWGFGGLVALAFLRQFPQPVRGLVLVGVNPKIVKDTTYEFGLSEEESHQALRELDRDYRRFLRGYAKRLFRPQAQPALLTWANAAAAKTPPHAARALAEAIIECDESEALREISCPVLLCQGDQDQITPVGAARFMSNLIPKATLEIFAESGHAPQIEEAQVFNERLSSFLKALG